MIQVWGSWPNLQKQTYELTSQLKTKEEEFTKETSKYKMQMSMMDKLEKELTSLKTMLITQRQKQAGFLSQCELALVWHILPWSIESKLCLLDATRGLVMAGSIGSWDALSRQQTQIWIFLHRFWVNKSIGLDKMEIFSLAKKNGAKLLPSAMIVHHEPSEFACCSDSRLLICAVRFQSWFLMHSV